MADLAQEPKFTLKQLAAGIAGYSIPLSTAKKLIRRGQLGSYVVAGRRLVGLHHLEELFRSAEIHSVKQSKRASRSMADGAGETARAAP